MKRRNYKNKSSIGLRKRDILYKSLSSQFPMKINERVRILEREKQELEVSYHMMDYELRKLNILNSKLRKEKKVVISDFEKQLRKVKVDKLEILRELAKVKSENQKFRILPKRKREFEDEILSLQKDLKKQYKNNYLLSLKLNVLQLDKSKLQKKLEIRDRVGRKFSSEKEILEEKVTSFHKLLKKEKSLKVQKNEKISKLKEKVEKLKEMKNSIQEEKNRTIHKLNENIGFLNQKIKVNKTFNSKKMEDLRLENRKLSGMVDIQENRKLNYRHKQTQKSMRQQNTLIVNESDHSNNGDSLLLSPINQKNLSNEKVEEYENEIEERNSEISKYQKIESSLFQKLQNLKNTVGDKDEDLLNYKSVNKRLMSKNYYLKKQLQYFEKQKYQEFDREKFEKKFEKLRERNSEKSKNLKVEKMKNQKLNNQISKVSKKMEDQNHQIIEYLNKIKNLNYLNQILRLNKNKGGGGGGGNGTIEESEYLDISNISNRSYTEKEMKVFKDKVKNYELFLRNLKSEVVRVSKEKEDLLIRIKEMKGKDDDERVEIQVLSKELRNSKKRASEMTVKNNFLMGKLRNALEANQKWKVNFEGISKNLLILKKKLKEKNININSIMNLDPTDSEEDDNKKENDDDDDDDVNNEEGDGESSEDEDKGNGENESDKLNNTHEKVQRMKKKISLKKSENLGRKVLLIERNLMNENEKNKNMQEEVSKLKKMVFS